MNCIFSFCFNFRKTNYACKECKKELKLSHWLNNVCLQSFSRLDWCASLNKERQRKSFAKLKQISSQNLVKTLCILHKMICKPKNFFTCSGPFANRFCFNKFQPWISLTEKSESSFCIIFNNFQSNKSWLLLFNFERFLQKQ